MGKIREKANIYNLIYTEIILLLKHFSVAALEFSQL